MGTIEDFDWVAQDHRDKLSGGLSAWGDEWPEHLSRVLDRQWPDWPAAGDAARQEWLDARIEALPLGWVTEDQRTRLAGIADGRGEWREWLPGQLDEWWPGWDQSTPDELVPWLDQALAALQHTEGTANPRELGWLTADQQTFLESLSDLRGDWHDWLPGQLDEWWPGWDRSTPDELVPWVNEALPSLTAQESGVDTGVEDLAWLTEQHRTQLDELYEIRGDWAQWLPGELDARWPEWRRSTPDVLGPWLDGILPGLVLPGEAGEILEQVAKPALAALYARIDDMAAEIGMTPDELAAEIEGLPSDFFAEIVLEELAA
ncbi:hypothetical protein [Labedaea rhizosphaerae]|uniref:Uncharacterized protein n=1 Tax=Labedaea rhizosphaerae TaxID=598644 RepID=A0A4R6S0G9_LABRH|nr:hypothetical protein [Labedaea rhizosphaerae]TDP92085.1 hypothetical protein EV186_108298 [Labedaea rhizosphaerae]